VIVSDLAVIQDQIQSLDNCYYLLKNSELTTYLRLSATDLDFIIWTSILFYWRLKNFLFPIRK